MPNIRHPSGYKEFHNLNADSKHPNPWSPPNIPDQICGRFKSAYKIYKPDYHNWWMKPKKADMAQSNFLERGPLSERMVKWTIKGFVVGKIYNV